MFTKILKELRIEKGLTQKEFAKEIGYAQSAVCSWENGEKEPKMSAIIAISKFFGVTTDYLLGLEK